MSKRYAFSNSVLDQLLAVEEDNRYTRDIPHRVIVAALPGTTPARESDKGRGQPVFDLYHPALPVAGMPGMIGPGLWSFKITKPKSGRNPRNAVVTSGNMGKGSCHVDKVMAAAEAGQPIVMICLNYNEAEDQWYRLEIDVSKVLAAHPPVEATGAHGKPCVHSKKMVPSGGRFLEYRSLRVNFAPCVKLGLTEGWIKVDRPELPREAVI